MSDEANTQGEKHPSLENKVVIMNGFDYEEITRIMRAVKALFDNPRDLIFAKTTDSSLEMKLSELIIDMSEDHEYLKNNPPNMNSRRGAGAGETEDTGSGSGGNGETDDTGSGSGGTDT